MEIAISVNPQEPETVLQVRTDAIAERLAAKDLRRLILDTTEKDQPSPGSLVVPVCAQEQEGREAWQGSPTLEYSGEVDFLHADGSDDGVALDEVDLEFSVFDAPMNEEEAPFFSGGEFDTPALVVDTLAVSGTRNCCGMDWY